MKNSGKIVLLLALLDIAPVHAQRDPKTPALRALTDCMAERDATRRLACYDDKVRALAKAEEAGDVVVTDRDRIRKSEQAALGLRTPRTPGRASSAPVRITATIRSVREVSYGKWLFALDNGMRWRQTDDERIFPQAGQSVTIQPASLGGYSMKLGSRLIRVARVS
jgi:hypothetical protein